MENMNCGICGEGLIPFTEDHRKALCPKCNRARCGWCGGEILGRFMPETTLKGATGWLLPPKILGLFTGESKNSCEKCGREYPPKRMIFDYLFWEARTLWLKISQSYKATVLELKALD